MAELVKTIVGASDLTKALVYTAAGASDYIVDDNKDFRLIVFAKNAGASAETLTLKAGNGHRAAAGDVTVSVPAGGVVAIPMARVDSSRVKNITGANSGKILTTAAGADITVAVLSIL